MIMTFYSKSVESGNYHYYAEIYGNHTNFRNPIKNTNLFCKSNYSVPESPIFR